MEILIFNRSAQWCMFLWILLFWTTVDYSVKCRTCGTNRSIFCISLFPSMEKRISLEGAHLWDITSDTVNYLSVVTKSIWLELRRSHHTYRYDVCPFGQLLPKDRKNTCIILHFSLYPLCVYHSSHWNYQSPDRRKNRYFFIARSHLANNPHGYNSICNKKYSLGGSNQNSDGHSNTRAPWLYAISDTLDYLGLSRIITNSNSAHQLNTNTDRSYTTF